MSSGFFCLVLGFFADDVVLLFCSLLSHDLQLSLGWFAAECEVSGISQLAPPGLRPWYSVRKQWSAHSRQGTRCCLK